MHTPRVRESIIISLVVWIVHTYESCTSYKQASIMCVCTLYHSYTTYELVLYLLVYEYAY